MALHQQYRFDEMMKSVALLWVLTTENVSFCFETLLHTLKITINSFSFPFWQKKKHQVETE